MRIHDGNLTGLSPAESGRAQETQKTGREETAGGSKAQHAEDRVEFSAGLSEVARAVSAFGADRAARVKELAAQYSSGNYRPDALATSRGMITEALSEAA